jgi:FdhD protein
VSGVRPRRVHRHRADEVAVEDDSLVIEEPVEFRLGDTPIAVLMRTPGHDEELARGFAVTEGIVLGPHEIAGIELVGPEAEGRYKLRLADGVVVDPEQFRRNLYTTSSCGVCGKASIDAVMIAALPAPAGPELTDDLVLSLPVELAAGQVVFDATGGLHGAAIFDAAGKVLVVREDIGRHNAVDKAIGALAKLQWPLGPVILMVSGRIGFEIAQKAAVAGIPVVAGVSAASSLAVELGEETGMTVIGFVRETGFNVYCGEDRFVAA